MVTPSYTVACLGNRRIARDIYEFRLEKPAGFSFRAGQFVLFDVPLLENSRDVQTRAFSVASAPEEGDLLFVAKMVAGGRASRWIAEALTKGASVGMKGPFGFFTLDAATEKDYLFLCTSTGIAPFRSQILAAVAAGDRRRMDLVFGVRAEEDLFWREELEAIAREHPNVALHIALSGGSPSWTGHRGRIQSVVPSVVPDFARRNVYACGSPVMTKEVKELALQTWGIPKADLHVEGYI